MNDDYRGDSSTQGSYRISDAPALIRSDFRADKDWLRIEGVVPFQNYQVFVYHAADDPLPISSMGWSFYTPQDGSESDVRYRSGLNRNQDFQLLSSNTNLYFASIGTPFGNNEKGYFRFFMRPEDEVGDTNSAGEALIPNVGFSRASAIDSNGDVDVYSFDFVAGQTYELGLTGISSRSTHLTTLGDPILRLFGSDGKFIKGDNNSGKGSDARLRFTPAKNEQLYLHVIGANGSTGSYRLESRQFDDFLGSTKTSGLLRPGAGPQSSVTNFANDRDWFRVPLLNPDYSPRNVLKKNPLRTVPCLER